MIAAALPVALAVGLLIGTLGGGGSILTVPALVHLLGLTAQQATASSLVIVGVTSLVSLVPHARRGNARAGGGLAFAGLGTAGTVAGSALQAHLPGGTILMLFATLMLVAAGFMLARALRPTQRGQAAQTAVPMIRLRPWRIEWPRLARLVLSAGCVGLLTGVLGVGGGFILVPALSFALGQRVRIAIGTSLLVIAVNSATAVLTRLALGIFTVDWPVIALFTSVTVVGSLVGARLAGRLPERTQTAALGFALLAVGLYTVTSAVR